MEKVLEFVEDNLKVNKNNEEVGKMEKVLELYSKDNAEEIILEAVRNDELEFVGGSDLVFEDMWGKLCVRINLENVTVDGGVVNVIFGERDNVEYVRENGTEEEYNDYLSNEMEIIFDFDNPLYIE